MGDRYLDLEKSNFKHSFTYDTGDRTIEGIIAEHDEDEAYEGALDLIRWRTEVENPTKENLSIPDFEKNDS